MRKQTGRSMIEMLGVLAIIGMLAIGGVWGIRKAFTKHNANNLIEDVRLAGFIVVDEMLETVLNAEGDVALNDKTTPQTNYTFKAFAEENSTTTFGILAQNVPFNVCEEVSKRKVDWLEEIRPNGLDNLCKEDNEISFFFNTELTTEPEFEENTCRSDRDCPVARPYCRGGYCSKCQTGYELTDGTCSNFPSIDGFEYKNTTSTYCHACGQNYLFSNNICFGCRSGTGVGYAQSAIKSECDRCPNRCWDESIQRCILSEEGNTFNNNGICNYTCPKGQYVATVSGNKICTNCPSITGFEYKNTTSTYCHACGQNYLFSNNICFGCRSGTGVGYAQSASKSECDRCSNRYFNETDKRCYLCPSGKYATSDGLSCE